MLVGGTGRRGVRVCIEAAVAVAGLLLLFAPAEAVSVVVGRNRGCRVEEGRRRAGMEACSGVAEQAVVVVVGGSAAARVWAG